MSRKVLITAKAYATIKGPLQQLVENGFQAVTDLEGGPRTEAELLPLIADAEGLITGLDQVTARVIAASPRLKVITKAGVGVDNIDVEAATQRGIAVTYVPDAAGDSVADLAFGLLLALARQIPRAHETMKAKKWQRIVGVELRGKTLGIVGTGRIGKEMARRGFAFGMKVVAYDIFRDEAFATAQGIQYLPLEELLRSSDFVSLHTPLAEDTKGLIDRRALALMRPSAYLINTSRGEIVDEEELCAALKEGRIAGAALDVFCQEPPFGSPLIELENVILSPHAGTFTHDCLERTAARAVQNTVQALLGSWPSATYCVNLGQLTGTSPNRMLKNSFDHPPGPLPGQEGGEFVSEGHPQTPGKGASPLCTPLFQHPAK